MALNYSKIKKGMIGGFAGSVVLMILMMMKAKMGVMPELNPVHMMADMVAEMMGMEPNVMIGWVMHFVIGTVVWGGMFAVFNSLIPAHSQIIKGVMLGIFAWLMMMIGPMPMGGAGLFGLNVGPMAPIMTFVFHIIFGVVLGAVFIKLGGRQEA